MKKIKRILLISIIIILYLYLPEVNALEEENNLINASPPNNISKDKSINYMDPEELIDDILEEKEIPQENDINNDQDININDITNIIYKNDTGNLENDKTINDNLDISLTTNNQNISIDNEFNVDLSINGFNHDKINGIEGTISYDPNVLNLLYLSYDTKDIKYGNINDKNKFIYILNDYNQNKDLLSFRFKPIKTGISTITIDNLILSHNGLDFKDHMNDINKLPITINNKVIPNNNNKSPSKVVSLSNKEKNYNSTKPIYAITDTGKKITISQIKLSSDNTIKSLIIKDHKIKFDKNILEYYITVDSKTDKLDLKVILNDEKAVYEIIGNENFKEGNNKVYIAVTAEDGSIKNYIINVKKEKGKKEIFSNSSRNVIIVLLIMIIISLTYIIFKDDDDE